METNTTVNSEAIFEELTLRKNIDHNGTIRYRDKKGYLHRILGPAVIDRNGFCVWYYHGKEHRIGGPAIRWSDGSYSWYINGKQYGKKSYWKEVERLKNGN